MGTAAPKESAAVATRDPKKHPIQTMIETPEARAFLEPFLPKGVTVERVAAQAILYVRDNPMIADCEPDTIIRGVAKALAWNLELGTTAYLVPFRTKVKLPGGKEEWRKIATFVPGYKGLAELMIASGAVRFVEAHVVFEKDDFTYEYGSEAQLRHVPWPDSKTRGRIIGAWCGLHLPFGRKAFHFEPIADIEATREKYSKQWNSEEVGECPPWYAMKTSVRRAAALVPKNPRLAETLLAIDNAEREIPLPIDAVIDPPRLVSGEDATAEPEQEATDDHGNELALGDRRRESANTAIRD